MSSNLTARTIAGDHYVSIFWQTPTKTTWECLACDNVDDGLAIYLKWAEPVSYDKKTFESHRDFVIREFAKGTLYLDVSW